MVFESILQTLTTDLKERSRLEISECFIDGTFVLAKKGLWGGNYQRGKGTADALHPASGAVV